MITNEEIVERVMRSGIEYRVVGDISKMFDIAKHEIVVSKQKNEALRHQALINAEHPTTLTEYFDQCVERNRLCFIFSTINSRLVVLRVDKIDKNKSTKIFSWGRCGNYIPYVEFA